MSQAAGQKLPIQNDTIFSLDERPFHCEECGRGFSQEDMILRHKNTHDEHRSFVCEDCGFASNNVEHLGIHRRQHFGDIFYCHFGGLSYCCIARELLHDISRSLLS